jgi:hypothetical protein
MVLTYHQILRCRASSIGSFFHGLCICADTIVSIGSIFSCHCCLLILGCLHLFSDQETYDSRSPSVPSQALPWACLPKRKPGPYIVPSSEIYASRASYNISQRNFAPCPQYTSATNMIESVVIFFFMDGNYGSLRTH